MSRSAQVAKWTPPEPTLETCHDVRRLSEYAIETAPITSTSKRARAKAAGKGRG